jgi:CRP-like cAMP-binding protein
MTPRDALLRYPLFALLDSGRLDAWLSAARETAFATGETVFQAGTPGLWAYLVLDGRVRVFRTGENGREVSLGTLGPDELFGEYALVPPGYNTATCRAAAPSRLLHLPLLAYCRALRTMPDVERRLKDWLRLHALVNHLRDRAFLGFMSAPSALKWLPRLQEVTLSPELTVQADGLADDRWFFIVSGEIALHSEGEAEGAEGRRLRAGDCFGEKTLAGHSGLPLAVTLTETTCLTLDRSAFDPRLASSGPPSGQSLLPRSSAGRGDYPWVGQQEASDCGLAAVAMVARFFGADATVDALRQRARIEQHGASLLELARLAAELGFHGQAVRIGIEQYPQAALPAVVHCRDGHYVVLYEYGSAGVCLGDPATGVVRLSCDLFHRTASGHLLLLRPPAASTMR